MKSNIAKITTIIMCFSAVLTITVDCTANPTITGNALVEYINEDDGQSMRHESEEAAIIGNQAEYSEENEQWEGYALKWFTIDHEAMDNRYSFHDVLESIWMRRTDVEGKLVPEAHTYWSFSDASFHDYARPQYPHLDRSKDKFDNPCFNENDIWPIDSVGIWSKYPVSACCTNYWSEGISPHENESWSHVRFFTGFDHSSTNGIPTEIKLRARPWPGVFAGHERAGTFFLEYAGFENEDGDEIVIDVETGLVIPNIPDANLKVAIKAELGKLTGDITIADMESLTSLDAGNSELLLISNGANMSRGYIKAYEIVTRFSLSGDQHLSTSSSGNNTAIVDLTGLEYAVNLESLDLRGNQIVDLSPLSGLANLEWLNLSDNQIVDLTPLSGMTYLANLYIDNNYIDITPGSQAMVIINTLISAGVDVNYESHNEVSHGSIQVFIEPAAARDGGALWSLTTGPDTGWKVSGDTITNLPPGSYTITFKEVADWNSPSDITVNINEGDNVERTGTYTDRVWIKGEAANTEVLALAYNSEDELTGTFPGFGVWYYNGSWSQMVGNDAAALAYDGDDNLAGTFNGFGVHVYDGTDWEELAANDATALAYSTGGELTASFPGWGVYRYDGAEWIILTGTEANALTYNANGNLVCSFPGVGVYELVEGDWVELSDVAASALAAGNDLTGSFPGFGVWVYDGAWSILTDATATSLAYSSTGDLTGAFGLIGVWYYCKVD